MPTDSAIFFTSLTVPAGVVVTRNLPRRWAALGTEGALYGLSMALSGLGYVGINDQEWWLEYGLDGIIGAIIGGLVTGAAVLLTLRHERKLVAEDRAAETAVRVQSTAWRLGKALQANPEDVARWAPMAHEVHEAVLLMTSACARSWPGIQDELGDAMSELDHVLHQDPRAPHMEAIVGAIAAVAGIASAWQINPDSYRKAAPARSAR